MSAPAEVRAPRLTPAQRDALEGLRETGRLIASQWKVIDNVKKLGLVEWLAVDQRYILTDLGLAALASEARNG